MKSAGFEGASLAKKKSGPRAIQAVPSFRSLASKLAVIASRRLGLFDLASSMSCVALDFSVATAGAISNRTRMPTSPNRGRRHIESVLLSSSPRFLRGLTDSFHKQVQEDRSGRNALALDHFHQRAVRSRPGFRPLVSKLASGVIPA